MTSNKRMQPDHVTRYASALAADARRYVALSQNFISTLEK